MGTKLSPVGSSQSGNGAKVYRALLTQTGTDDPVATVLENTLGGEVVWARTSTGIYKATLTGAFPADKVFCYIQGTIDGDNFDGNGTVHLFTANRGADNNTVRVCTLMGSMTIPSPWALADDMLVGQSVEFSVYP